METAGLLMAAIGEDEYSDYNVFLKLVNKALKDQGIKHSASERNQILGMVSWYDETVEKVSREILELEQENEGLIMDILNL